MNVTVQTTSSRSSFINIHELWQAESQNRKLDDTSYSETRLPRLEVLVRGLIATFSTPKVLHPYDLDFDLCLACNSDQEEFAGISWYRLSG